MAWTAAPKQTRLSRSLWLGAALLAAGLATAARPRPGERAVGTVVGMVRLQSVAEAPPPMLSPYARPRYRNRPSGSE